MKCARPTGHGKAQSRAARTINISEQAKKLLASSGEEKDFYAYLDKHLRFLPTAQGSNVVTGYRLQSGTVIWVISDTEKQTTTCFCPGD